MEERMGLLHVGFNTGFQYSPHDAKDREPDYIDRLVLYLSLSDGWRRAFSLISPQDREFRFEIQDKDGMRVRKSIDELRQILATKAFEVLSHNLFRREPSVYGDHGHERREYFDYWERLVNPRLLPTLIAFFRVVEKHGNFFIHNLTSRDEPRQNEKHAHNFLVELAKFMWRWKETVISKHLGEDDKKHHGTKNITIRTLIDGSMPWMVEVLYLICRLDVLDEWILELTEPCITKLTEISMRTELVTHQHAVNKSRRVCSLEEASYAGSETAWFLMRRKIKMGVKERLEVIMRAEDAQEEAAERLRELQSSLATED